MTFAHRDHSTHARPLLFQVCRHLTCSFHLCFFFFLFFPFFQFALGDWFHDDHSLVLVLPWHSSEWTDNGQLWVQYVSSTPATRNDVISLQENLDKQLQQRQARETGICPIREELYAQCFDELIRQVTVNCAERGLLVLRVRDEIRMTIAAYQTLYESSIAFGMRKALMAEQRKAEMETLIKTLEGETQDLEKQVKELHTRCSAIETREAEQRDANKAKHDEEVARLKEVNDKLKASLESLLSTPKGK